jgi:hypothetical protein
MWDEMSHENELTLVVEPFGDGTTQEQDVPVGATSCATVNVNESVGPDREVSLKVTSDAPIVAERPMYFSYRGA